MVACHEVLYSHVTNAAAEVCIPLCEERQFRLATGCSMARQPTRYCSGLKNQTLAHLRSVAAKQALLRRHSLLLIFVCLSVLRLGVSAREAGKTPIVPGYTSVFSGRPCDASIASYHSSIHTARCQPATQEVDRETNQRVELLARSQTIYVENPVPCTFASTSAPASTRIAQA